jgi:exosortase A
MNTAVSPSLPWRAVHWRRLAPCIALVLAALLLFRSTAQAMVHIWNTSDTFAHAFLVAPISLWLIWRLRDRLARLPTQSLPWMLLPMALVALLWLVGELAAAQAVTQFALVALLVLSVPAVLGWPVTRALLFPLLFLFFAVPVGDFMVPQMMEWTADFTVAALQVTGIPVYREGLQFVVPTGNWSVVSACSGVRYLIASFMVGTLFAYLNFRTPYKRAIFIVLSLLVPVVANWLRAYMIVMIGHLSGNKLAVGVDHIIYGWVFFGLVIGLMFWIGARYAEPEPEPEDAPGPASTPAAQQGHDKAPATAPQVTTLEAPWPTATSLLTPWWVGALAVAVMATAQAAAWQSNRERGGPPPSLTAPERLDAWSATDASVSDWVPDFKRARSVAARSYKEGQNSEARTEANTAAIWVGYYRDQGYDAKLVTSTNVLVTASEGAPWASTSTGQKEVMVPGLGVPISTAEVRSSLAPLAASGVAGQKLRVWHTYWIGGRFVASGTQARLLLSLNRLTGQGDDSAIVILYTPVVAGPGSGAGAATGADTTAAQADAVLQRFANAALPALSKQLAVTRANPPR